MRSTCSALLLLTLVAGCGQKKKDDSATSTISGSASGAAKPADEKPEPVGKGPAKPADDGKAPARDTSPAAGAGGDVRPPQASDLELYTKDIPGQGQLKATIETSMGTIHCDLLPDKAPMTVANFVGLATGKKAWQNPKTGSVETNKPYYDGLIFHRVIPGFMIQGGDPTGSGNGGPGYGFEDEVNNGLVMKPGTLAMANTGQPMSNGGQFFITDGSPDWLNNHHTIFGSCKEIDVVTAIENVPAGRNNRPNTPVTINKITFSKG